MQGKITKILKKTLTKEPQIKFVYLFGSIIKEKRYNDIDVGVYIAPLVEENVFKITSDLKCKISRALMKIGLNIKPDNIDVVVLNLVAFTFLNRVFKEGVLIFDRDPDLRTSLIEKNSITYRECVGILREAEIL
ncbi:MAG: nucleotidyltransferase domain-containing protein [bacterium]